MAHLLAPLRRVGPLACFAALMVLGLTTAVTLAWITEAPWLLWTRPDATAMTINSALCLALNAFALLAFARRARRTWACVIPAGASAAIGITTLLQYLTQTSFGLDQWLISDRALRSGGEFPGRPAPVTIACVLLMAFSFFAARPAAPRVRALGRFGLVIALLTAVQAIAAVMLGFPVPFGSYVYSRVSLLSGVCVLLLSAARLALDDVRLPRGLARETPTTRTARLLLVATLVVPSLVHWMSVLARRRGAFDPSLAELMQTLGITGLMAMIVLAAGRALVLFETRYLARARALAASEERFRALIGVAAEMVWTKDAEGLPTSDSPTWRTFTGQSRASWFRGEWMQFVHPDDHAETRAAWLQAMAERRPYGSEYRVRHHDGEYRWMIARATPLLDGDGSVREWIGMNFNIHERKMAEVALQRAKDEAERANMVKSTFLANMSHEIRTPLGAVMGFAELCAEDDADPADRRTYFAAVKRNGEQLSNLIADILDLAKVEAGELTVTRVAIDPAQVAGEVLANLKAPAERNRLRLELKRAAGVPRAIVTDPTRLRQILTNVVANAIKFTERGSVALDCEARDERVLFRVTDSGIGIPPAQHDRIFEPFVQADASPTRRFGGTGLGLALSRDLARLLGGELSLERSEVGRGSTFLLEIPV